MAGIEKKPRKPARAGIRQSSQAFCRECGWESCHWYGEGQRGNAAGELRHHKEEAERLFLVCSNAQRKIKVKPV